MFSGGQRCADINYSKHFGLWGVRGDEVIPSYVFMYLSTRRVWSAETTGEGEKTRRQNWGIGGVVRNQCLPHHHRWDSYQLCLLCIYLRRVRQDEWASERINDDVVEWGNDTAWSGEPVMIMWWFFFLLLYWSTLTPPGQKTDYSSSLINQHIINHLVQGKVIYTSNLLFCFLQQWQ